MDYIIEGHLTLYTWLTLPQPSHPLLPLSPASAPLLHTTPSLSPVNAAFYIDPNGKVCRPLYQRSFYTK